VGLRYAFNLVTRADAVDELLRELATHLQAEDRERLIAQVPWRAAIERDLVWGSGHPVSNRQGIRDIAADADLGERPNDLCLCFDFPPDSALERYAAGDPIRRPTTGVLVGCVWTKLHVGECYALLVATAASSDMSVLFERSASVRNVWSQLAERSGAFAVFLDTEQAYEWALLWPEPRSVCQVNADGYWSGDFENLRVDAYCEEMLRAARVV
jgi:hypothetical protein